MSRVRWAVVLLAASAACVASCAKKREVRDEPGAAAVGSEAETPEQTRSPDVGAGDFVDYATGKKPLEIGKRLEKKLQGVQSDRNKLIEEQLGE